MCGHNLALTVALLFSSFLGALTYREEQTCALISLFSLQGGPSLEQRFESYYNYCNLFNYILSKSHFCPGAVLGHPTPKPDSSVGKKEVLWYTVLEWEIMKDALAPFRQANFCLRPDFLVISTDADGPAPLELPNQWLWDIIDEFIYQVPVQPRP